MVMSSAAFANVEEFRKTDPEFAEFFGNFAGVEVPSQSKLEPRTRYMAILAALMGCQGVEEFRAILPEALEAGLTPSEVKEVIYQGTAYLGIGRTRADHLELLDLLPSIRDVVVDRSMAEAGMLAVDRGLPSPGGIGNVQLLADVVEDGVVHGAGAALAQPQGNVQLVAL